MISTLVFLIVCCCCKGCRILWFKLWDKWSPKSCWKETTEKFYINITNIQGKHPSVKNHAAKTSLTTSIQSLPSLPNIITLTPDKDDEEEIKDSLPIPLRRSLRDKKNAFR